MRTATTALLAGRGRTQRRKALLRALGPCVGGAPRSPERRAFWRFAAIIPIANFAGAVDLFLFLWYVLPLPSVTQQEQVQDVNAWAFAAYMVLTFVLCGSASKAIARPIADWLDSGLPADEEMVARVLRHPVQQARLSAIAWLGGAVIFALLNAYFSVALGAIVGAAILMGGVTTLGVMYLMTDRAMRPITAAALSGHVPREPSTPAVDVRVLLSFAVTTVSPLLGIAALGVIVLTGGEVSSDRIGLTVAVLALAALAAGFVSMKLLARSLAEPLRSVREALARVERGDLDAEVPVDDGSEVGVLQAGFNSMVAGLRERQQLRDLFGRHVGEDVVRAALERGTELGGEQRDAAVVFVDVLGSTSLAAERSPDEVVGLLNRFFGLVVEVVHEHGGCINKFEGDGALCLFGAPDDIADPAGRALAAARTLDARLRAELPELPAAIGVSSGRVVAGNVGAAERYEYTVIGDPVNEAARLTQLAKATAGRVLASAETLVWAGPHERECWRADGRATLRGRPRPTELVVPSAQA